MFYVKIMKGLEKTRLCLENKKDLYTFLNSTAESFYRGAFIFQDKVDFANKLKADVLYFLIEVERVIKATFHSSLKLENVELDKFRKMFPNLSNQIFKIDTYDDLVNLGSIINVFRNINDFNGFGTTKTTITNTCNVFTNHHFF